MSALLVASRREPWLELVGSGGRRTLPTIEGIPFRVRTGRRGHWAYISLGAAAPEPSWAAALVVHGPEGDVIDARPGAVITGAPAFHPDGDSVCYVRETDDEQRELVELDLESGVEVVHLTDDGVRSCAWAPDERLVVSLTDRIDMLAPASGIRTTLVLDEVASGFAQWGTDDLYVTLDDLCMDSNGRLAWTRSWHQQGRASRGDVHLRGTDGDRTFADARGPRFVEGELTVVRGSTIVWTDSGKRTHHADLEDFDVWSAS